jgi:uncharacterized protein YeaO (DUF488 family)
MAIRVIQLGTPRDKGEGVRVGTVRRPPRGVRKEDYGHRDYYDLWLPELAPRAPLVSWAFSQPFDSKRWATYERKYKMRKPSPQRLIALQRFHRAATSLSDATVAMNRVAIAPFCANYFLSRGPEWRNGNPDRPRAADSFDLGSLTAGFSVKLLSTTSTFSFLEEET